MTKSVEITVCQRGLRPLWTLLKRVVQLRESAASLSNIRELDINVAKEKRLDYDQSMQGLRLAIRPFLHGNLSGVDEADFLDAVLEVNIPADGGKKSSGTMNQRMLDNWYYTITARLMDLGATYIEAVEMINFQSASRYLEEWRKIRGDRVMDQAVSFGGSDIREYIARLNGEQLMTRQEFMAMMEERMAGKTE